MKNYLSIALVLVLFLSSCGGKEKLPAEQYYAWIKNPDNGILQKKEIKPYAFSLQYKPAAFTYLLENQKEKTSAEKLQQHLKDNSDMQYFNLRIASADGKANVFDVDNRMDYNQKLSYFVFDLKQDIYMVDGADTLPCLLYHYERNYDLTPFIDISLAFKQGKAVKAEEEETKEKNVIINAGTLGVGVVKFQLTKEDLKRIPELTL